MPFEYFGSLAYLRDQHCRITGTSSTVMCTDHSASYLFRCRYDLANGMSAAGT